MINLAATPDGGIVLYGELKGTVDFGGGPLRLESSYAAYVVRLDGAGEHVWSRRYPEPGSTSVLPRAPGLVLAPDGGYFFHADCSGAITFPGGGSYVAEGHLDDCLFRFDADGLFAGALEFPRSSGFALRGIALDPWGQAVIAGDFDAALDLGAGPLVPARREGLLIRTDAGLAPFQTLRLAGPGTVQLSALSVTPGGEIVASGSSSAGVELPDASAAAGVFVTRIAP